MKAIKDFCNWLYRLFKPEKPKYRKLPESHLCVNIAGVRYWKNQLVGKSEDELRKYFYKKGLVMSPEDLSEIHRFINHLEIKK